MADYDGHSSYYAERTRTSHEQAQREPHLLNLKVLRAARPSFTQSKDLFRDETSTEQSASTSGFTLTPLLALPTAFGNINLGETFQGLIVAANDSPQDIYDASLRIEMQTTNSRVTLWESPPPDKDNPHILKPGDSLEAPLLKYEIKEPGLHSLTCSVSYWAPARNLSFMPQPGAGEKHMRSFRKLYKFQATNPLAVKTKIHSTRNAAAQLDEESERTVFLEVQIQNTSPEPLHLDQPSLNPAEYQEVDDVSNLPGGQIQPGDLLQCLYVVKSQASHYHKLIEKAKHSNGVIPLGRLDIKWRNRMGDQGHLSTSQLLRRVPQHLLPPVPSPRPPMQKNVISLAPQQTPEKGGQARNRDLSPMQSPQLDSGTALSPGVSPRMQQHEFPRHHLQSKDLTAALHVLPMVAKCERVGEPFAVKFKLSLTSFLRDTEEKQASQTRRILKLAVQHVDHNNIPAVNTNAPVAPAADFPMVPHLHPDAAPLQSARTSIDTEKPLPSTLAVEGYQAPLDNPTIHLPPPFALLQDNPFFYPSSSSSVPPSTKPDPQCASYGNTLKWLEPISLSHGPAVRKSKEASSHEPSTLIDTETRISTDSSSTTDNLPLDEVMRVKSAEWTQHTEVEFELQYLAYSTGIFKLGGIRILLLEDKWGEENGEEDYRPGLMPCTLLENNVVAEIRVGS